VHKKEGVTHTKCTNEKERKGRKGAKKGE